MAAQVFAKVKESKREIERQGLVCGKECGGFNSRWVPVLPEGGRSNVGDQPKRLRKLV